MTTAGKSIKLEAKGVILVYSKNLGSRFLSFVSNKEDKRGILLRHLPLLDELAHFLLIYDRYEDVSREL